MCRLFPNQKQKSASTERTSRQAWKATHYIFQWNPNEHIQYRYPYKNQFRRSCHFFRLAEPAVSCPSFAAHIICPAAYLCPSNGRVRLGHRRAWIGRGFAALGATLYRRHTCLWEGPNPELRVFGPVQSSRYDRYPLALCRAESPGLEDHRSRPSVPERAPEHEQATRLCDRRCRSAFQTHSTNQRPPAEWRGGTHLPSGKH